MAFWILAMLTALLAITRFAPLKRHVGFVTATLVLVLRLSAIAVAVLLASPIFIRTSQTVKSPSRVVVLVDSSPSVDAEMRTKALKMLVNSLGERKNSVLAWEFANELKPVKLGENFPPSAGDESRLSKSILSAVEMMQPDELLVLTDAQDTDPLPDKQVVEALRKAGTKLSAVILPANLPPNLSLKVAPAQAFLFSGEEAKFDVLVSGERVGEKAFAQVRVWEDKRLIFRTNLSLVNGKAQTTVAIKPSSSGWNRYKFEVLSVKGEVWFGDNRCEVLVWRAPTKLRVLVVTGQPNFEFKFVKQAIESEPNFEWVAIASLPDKTRYQQGSPQLMPTSLTNPEKFHVIVVIAPTTDEFSAAEGNAIWQFVQAGGGLLLTLSELSIRTKGWRFFVPHSLTFAPLPSPSPLSPVKEDPLGSQLPSLAEIDAAWSIGAFPSFAHTALQSLGNPTLVWWQEGLGKVAILAFDGTWRWVMESARKGEQPETHRKFWRTLVRFLADPTKGEKVEMPRLVSGLLSPSQPPKELSLQPNPKRVEAWVKATDGQMLQPESVGSWVKKLSWSKSVKVSTQQPISATPLPYLLLLAALTIEWWLIRRSGLT